jgi:hypothetical protein
MDPISYMIMSKSTGYVAFDILLIVVIMPMLSQIIEQIKPIIMNLTIYIINLLNFRKAYTIKFKYSYSNVHGEEYINIKHKISAISYILKDSANNLFYFSNLNKEDCYVLSEGRTFKHGNIYIKINVDFDSNQKSNASSWHTMIYEIELKSYKNLEEIQNFVEESVEKYNKYLIVKNKKQYHFIFQNFNSEDHKYIFSSNVINDVREKQNEYAFRNIYNKKITDILISDITRLRNSDYYKKMNLRRKKGYIFHGEPGTGKTQMVRSLAEFDGRHIIEIPISRIKSEKEFECLINLNEINNISFKHQDVIYLFDEIDHGLSEILNSENTKKKSTGQKSGDDDELFSIKPVTNSFNISCMLSRLDGVSTYDGIIFIATTNNIDKLPPALIRPGRLTPIHFTYMEKDDIINMIESYYNIKINSTNFSSTKISNKFNINKITPANLQYLLETNSSYKKLGGDTR